MPSALILVECRMSRGGNGPVRGAGRKRGKVREDVIISEASRTRQLPSETFASHGLLSNNRPTVVVLQGTVALLRSRILPLSTPYRASCPQRFELILRTFELVSITRRFSRIDRRVVPVILLQRFFGHLYLEAALSARLSCDLR